MISIYQCHCFALILHRIVFAEVGLTIQYNYTALFAIHTLDFIEKGDFKITKLILYENLGFMFRVMI